ncbi:MAG: phosphatidylserine decarboxylase [Gammaproteobacteria bacterium]|nr:phosphatidylserine decarboxylase [Gammaproteobacteria bacterium]
MNLRLFFQEHLPHHLLSRAIGRLADCRIVWLKNLFIRCFVYFYKIDLVLAVEPDIAKYPSFNSFFTRAIKSELRPIADSDVVSPVDGKISQIGKITKGQLIQAKGREYGLEQLLAGQFVEHYSVWRDGNFTTLYLSPRDYHRVHMPCDGKLLAACYVPGHLFSVSDFAAEHVADLYARNERLVLLFETKFGPAVVVLVGAMLVASIVTSWDGIITPNRDKKIRNWDYRDSNIEFKKGDELGRFQFGSTVIMLFPERRIEWSRGFSVGDVVRFGERLGEDCL